MIPEPQRTYLLELLEALGPAADDFVVAGAQAIKFAAQNARGTKDVDFILNVIALRNESLQLAHVFESLGYAPVPESRNFQFVKPIPNNTETMRIEFMARKNSSARTILESIFSTAFMPELVSVAESRSQNLTCIPSRATSPMALRLLGAFASRDRMPSS